MLAISNTPIDNIEETPEGNLYHFLTTPYMSTYLLVWVIGRFDYIEAVSKSGINVCVYTPVGRKSEGEFALDIGTRCIDFYSEYFGIPYALKKLDLVFLHGNGLVYCIAMNDEGMENWGCITFPERILSPKAITSLDPIYQSARIICHEISHMWFGNLVTMKWWSHLWLNEGFARYMEIVAVDKLLPNFKIWERFYPQVMLEALDSDIMPRTHPIEMKCKTVREIDDLFDPISYSKGGCLLRMLNDYIGETEFRKAICLYLKTHSYSNTISNDLWRVFDEVTGKPITEMMNKWIQTAGYFF